MKYILILFVIVSAFACKKCPECFDISGPVRIIYLDDNGENLLANGTLKPKRVSLLDSDTEIAFGVKDFVVNGSSEKYHMEFANEELHSACQSKLCSILIEFEDNVSIDTLLYSIEELKTDCCTSFSVTSFEYDKRSYLNMEENTIGAFEVLK